MAYKKARRTRVRPQQTALLHSSCNLSRCSLASPPSPCSPSLFLLPPPQSPAAMPLWHPQQRAAKAPCRYALSPPLKVHTDWTCISPPPHRAEPSLDCSPCSTSTRRTRMASSGWNAPPFLPPPKFASAPPWPAAKALLYVFFRTLATDTR